MSPETLKYTHRASDAQINKFFQASDTQANKFSSMLIKTSTYTGIEGKKPYIYIRHTYERGRTQAVSTYKLIYASEK